MKRAICTTLMMSLSLTACGLPNPPVVTTYQYGDQSKSCEELEEAIVTADNFKRDARKEDYFQWRYVFIFPAIIGSFRATRAENSAKDRSEYLSSIYETKGCGSRKGTSSYQDKVPEFPAPPPEKKPEESAAAPAPQQPTNNMPAVPVILVGPDGKPLDPTPWQNQGVSAPSAPPVSSSYVKRRVNH